MGRSILSLQNYYKLLGRYNKKMREADNNSYDLYFFHLWVPMNIKFKHSCQLFRMDLRDKTAPTLTTPLIRANTSCAVATIFSSHAFLSSYISMANLSQPLVAASFSSLAHFSSSVSTTNLSCLLTTAFSSLRFLSNSLSSPRFDLLRVARRCFLWFSVFLLSCLILSLSFFCLQSLSSVCFKFPISK